MKILIVLAVIFTAFKASATEDLHGSWTLVDSYCENGSPIGGESASFLKEEIESGFIRTFSNRGTSRVERGAPQALVDKKICSADGLMSASMKYEVEELGPTLLLSMWDPEIEVKECQMTSLTLGAMRRVEGSGRIDSREILVEGDRLFIFKYPELRASDRLCAGGGRTVTEYQRKTDSGFFMLEGFTLFDSGSVLER